MIDYFELYEAYNEEEEFYELCHQCRPGYPPPHAPVAAVRLCQQLHNSGTCRRDCPGLAGSNLIFNEDDLEPYYRDRESDWEDAYENRRLHFHAQGRK